MTFGEKLQDLRRKAGMSQDTLAERLDVSRQAVSKWERDETMPETEKLVRIAQLFDASLDELLLNREPQKASDPEPQPVYRPTYRPNYRDQFRRQGYKLGYILMAIGGLICAFCLIMRLVFPAIGNSFIGSASDFMSGFTGNAMSSFSPFGDVEIIWEGDTPLTPDEEQAILDAIGGSNSNMGDLWGSTANQMSNMMDNMATSALQAQANLFLLGLIPGIALLAAGAVIVVKGKKYARQGPDIT